MALEDDIDFLDQIPTLHILGRDVLRILAISAESIRVEGGEVLFEEGQPADGGYVVFNGAIMLRSAREPKASEATIARLGALIGETALIVDTIRPATATALETSTVLRISRSVFLRTLEGEPEAAAALRKVISRRVRGVLDELDIVAPLFKVTDQPRDPNSR
jgi:CRP-like cAMP-binding protein